MGKVMVYSAVKITINKKQYRLAINLIESTLGKLNLDIDKVLVIYLFNQNDKC